ncbi:amino acid permease-associated region [Rubrobacter xylanophilus DSM 9941]|uniref:Amino acid permease-associated region n=1 Tax=Rubrobacter xylanophilus (strain DSM 9941 / JCM 11954 / NBRC 16129 / PRD-1) TaxID=266117 RepID=Q1ASB5_RUBXD|nr:APC family permease [Rubrobacter xylanophilus]ABG05713.1 amino acid permease-associated region [Rubrobacter xylanophilus DSM 9941]
MEDRVRYFEDADRKLKRELGFQQLFFLSFGSIIGSGWLFAALAGAAIAGPAALLSWVIGAVLLIFVGLNYAETSCMIPRSGSVVRYPHLTHGGFLGFIMSWSFMLGTVTVTAIEALAVVQYASVYVRDWTGVELTTVREGVAVLTGAGIVLAVLLMILFFVVNIFGVRFFGEFNRWVSWWKTIIPVLTFVLLFFAFRASNFTEFGGFAPRGFDNVFNAVATAGIVFAYFGFRQGLDFGGEARNPQRDIPAATILSLAAAGAIYFFLQLAFLGALDWDAAGVNPGDWAALNDSEWASQPLYYALESNGGVLVLGAASILSIFAVVLLVDAAISPAGTGWIYMGSSARVLYGMAMHDDLPRWLTRVEDRTGIPMVALVAALVVGCIFFLPFPGWYILVGFITGALVFTFVMGGVQVQVMRRTAPDLPRPYWLKGAAVFSPLGFLAGSMIFYWAGYETLRGVVAAVLIGLALYAFFQGPRRNRISYPVGLALGIPFAVVWLATQYFGPAPLGNGALPFFAYWVLCVAEVVGFVGLVWLFASDRGRREVKAAWWVLFLALALYLLSYYGTYGPLENPPVPFPWDNLIALAVGLVAYYWGVASGYETEEMRSINESGTGLVPTSEEEESLGALRD